MLRSWQQIHVGMKWNVWNGLKVLKILHSVDQRVDYVLLLVLVPLLSELFKYVIWLQVSLLQKVHESVDVIMKNWLHGLSLSQNILAVNRKNGCLSYFICAQWIKVLALNLSRRSILTYEVVVHVVDCRSCVCMF